MNKLLITAVIATTMTGCNLTPVPVADLPTNGEYTGNVENFGEGRMVAYTVVKPVPELKSGLEVCLNKVTTSQNVTFSGTSHSTGAFTGNLYSHDTNSTNIHRGKNLQAMNDILVATEQVSNAFVVDGFISVHLKHEVAVKYEENQLMMKFFSLEMSQADSGSISNSGFSGGIPTYMSGFFWGSVGYYEQVAEDMNDCVTKSFF